MDLDFGNSVHMLICNYLCVIIYIWSVTSFDTVLQTAHASLLSKDDKWGGFKPVK